MSAPSLPDLLRQAMEARLAEVHVSLPGRVESYDHATQKASVKPLIKRRLTDGRELDLPVIVNVPVVFPRSATASLTFPINRGDGVLLVFSERALELWLSKGGVQAPGAPRKHALTDAIAIPGLYPFSQASPAEDNTSLLLRLKNARLNMADDGTIVVSNGAQAAVKISSDGKTAMGNDKAELLDLFDQTLQALMDSLCIQGSFLTQKPKFTQIKADLQKIKGAL